MRVRFRRRSVRRRWKQRRPGLRIGVCGCVAQQEGQRIFSRAPYVDFVIGPRAIGSLPGILAGLERENPVAGRSVDTEYREDSIRFPFDEIRRDQSYKVDQYEDCCEELGR